MSGRQGLTRSSSIVLGIELGRWYVANIAIDDGLTIVNRALGYTAAGATQTDSLGSKTYTWNARNRMAAANVGGTVTDYEYNALGQRTRKVGVENRRYHHDHGGRLLGQTNSVGAVAKEYIWAEGIQFGSIDAVGSLSFAHEDHLGAVVARSDFAGTTTAEWVRLPFGESVTGIGPSNIETGFPGQVEDAETSLNQNWMRSYDPTLGAYLNPDPAGLAGGTALYGYAHGDPVQWADPTGLAPNPPRWPAGFADYPLSDEKLRGLTEGQLREFQDKLRRNGFTDEFKKVQRHQKRRDQRNKGKPRGGPKMRIPGAPNLLLPFDPCWFFVEICMEFGKPEMASLEVQPEVPFGGRSVSNTQCAI